MQTPVSFSRFVRRVEAPLRLKNCLVKTNDRELVSLDSKELPTVLPLDISVRRIAQIAASLVFVSALTIVCWGSVFDMAIPTSPTRGTDLLVLISGFGLLCSGLTLLLVIIVWTISIGLSHVDSQKKMQRIAQYSRSLIEASLDPLVTISPDGKITDVNEANVKILGVQRDELLGKNFCDYFTEPERAKELYQEVLVKGAIRDYPLTIRDTGGKLIPVEYNASTYKDTDGRVVGVLAAARDCTETRDLEEHLQAERMLLAARDRLYSAALLCEKEEQLGKICLSEAELLTCSNFGYIAELNAEGRLDIVAISDLGDELCGNPQVRSTHSLKNIASRGVDRSMLREGKTRIVNGEDVLKAQQNHLSIPEGHPPLSTFMGVPMKEHGKIIGMIALANKETGYTLADQENVESLAVAFVHLLRRKRAERAVLQFNQDLQLLNRELEQAREHACHVSQFKSEFVANISHEIRTPLNGMLGMAEVLARTELNLKQRHYVDTIIDAGRTLKSVLNDVLNLSKIEAGKLFLEISEFAPVSLVEGVGDLFAPIAQQKELSLLTFVDPKIPLCLSGDPVRLREVLFNLMSNAVKFSENGEVVIRATLETTEASSVCLHFSVSDNGIGMTNEQIAGLFEPFTQAHRLMTGKYGGTGLGLYISNRLVNLMGGKIFVSSAPGKGSTFEFSIPLQENTYPTPDSKGIPLHGMRILVVDDQPNAREIIQQYIVSWGARTTEATTAAEGLKLLGDALTGGDPYDIAIINSLMPVEGSLDLAEEIALDPALRCTGIILTSANNRVAIPEQAIDKHTAGSLCKPIRRSDLLNILNPEIRDTRDGFAKSPDTPQPAAARSERILVVDDHRINIEVAVLLLRDLGFESHFADNGRSAIEALDTVSYALVFMDVQMPDMDGFEAMKIIRRNEMKTARHVPVIAMTAYAMEGSLEDCLAAGMDDYISKPVDSERLREIIEKWLPESVRTQVRENRPMPTVTG